MNKQQFTKQVLEAEASLYHVAHTLLVNEEDCADAIQNAILAAQDFLPDHGAAYDVLAPGGNRDFHGDTGFNSATDFWNGRYVANDCQIRYCPSISLISARFLAK